MNDNRGCNYPKILSNSNKIGKIALPLVGETPGRLFQELSWGE